MLQILKDKIFHDAPHLNYYVFFSRYSISITAILKFFKQFTTCFKISLTFLNGNKFLELIPIILENPFKEHNLLRRLDKKR